jgi:hypothetical protein
VYKVVGPSCRSAGLLVGRVHLIGTSGTLVGGDPWVPMSVKPPIDVLAKRQRQIHVDAKVRRGVGEVA